MIHGLFLKFDGLAHCGNSIFSFVLVVYKSSEFCKVCLTLESICDYANDGYVVRVDRVV